MGNEVNNTTDFQPDPVPDSVELAISRVVDRRATRTDWDALEKASASEPGLWRELALTQRDHALLGEAVRAEIAVADGSSLPVSDTSGLAEREERLAMFRHRTLRASGWAGWAVAAALVLAFIGNRNYNARNAASTNAAGFNPDIRALAGKLPADQLRDLYMAKGKQDGVVVGEGPNRIVQRVEKMPDGAGYQVIYIRPIIERETVENFYRLSNDEAGQPRAIRVDFNSKGPALARHM